MKNSKKQLGNQKNNLPAKQVILKLQLNGLQLEITSQNEQYSLVELNALLDIIAENKNQLLAVSNSEYPLKNQHLNGRNKDLLKSYIPSQASSRFPPIRQNHDHENNKFRIEY